MAEKIAKNPILEKRFNDLYQKYAKDIACILGVLSIPAVEIKIAKGQPYIAQTIGNAVFASQKYFTEREDDGAIIHEFVHVIMMAPVYNKITFWLIEGIADYVRDRLGFQTSWSREHYESGRALAGYQTSAHFLMYLEKFRPTIIKELSALLIKGAYDKNVFMELSGKSLNKLVNQYEEEQEGS